MVKAAKKTGKRRRGGKRAGYDESPPWGEIAHNRRLGWTFRELREKYSIPESTLCRVLNDRLGAFPGDEAPTPLEEQAVHDDKRTPSQIAWDALVHGLRKVERKIKSRVSTSPKDLESLLNIHVKLIGLEAAEGESQVAEKKLAEIREERRALADKLDNLYDAQELDRLRSIGARDGSERDGEASLDDQEEPDEASPPVGD